ncbi:pancreatic lipase-related protein 2-like isoform X2 [Zophobas morio]|uniref:pancreatic lipase-related protein 2-like isoform X2 n=1 Tax=Zophobas morio TaxID=2755281 RepID=UPI003082C862
MQPANMSIFVKTLMFVMNQSNYQNEDDSYNYYFMEIGKTNNASKCYGSYGCFQLTPPWTSEHRPVSLFPEELEKTEPRFPYYTRKHRTPSYVLDLNDFDVFGDSDIDFFKPIYVIAHGYMEGGGIPWVLEMANEFLDLEDCSVIVVDWHGGSGPHYTQAVANIRLVGAVTTHLIYELSKKTGYKKLDHVHCVGHSLGAHMCGYVGYALQQNYNLTLGRISGLDPAEPHFANAKPPIRLDRSAAYYVDVVHTDASHFIRGGLGIIEKIGHVDYYPNGGSNQPGCGKSVAQYIADAKGSFFLGIRRYLGCNHLRSHEIFFESIKPKGGCRYLTVRCPSYEEFLAGKCFDCGRRNERCIRFGYHGRKDYNDLIRKQLIKPDTNLVMYLITGEKRPYCRAHYKVTVKISTSDESVRHGGEVGQLVFTMHSTTDGKGPKTISAPLNKGGYHEPGKIYTAIVPTDQISKLKAVEVEWQHQNSVFNPLTWRILAVPMIYVEFINIIALEIGESITVCPKDKKPLQNSKPSFMIPSYC